MTATIQTTQQMKTDDLVSSIAIFFNDFVGAWIPGSVLAVGLAIMHIDASSFEFADTSEVSVWLALTVVGLLFALGHLILAIHAAVLGRLLQRACLMTPFDIKAAKTRQSYKIFEGQVNSMLKIGAENSWDYHELRSVALTSSSEASALGRRFMFLSLLCSGTGTALSILGLDYLACLTFSPNLLNAGAAVPPAWLQAATIFLAAFFLFKRSEFFYSKAMVTPFSVSMTELALPRRADANP